MAQGKENSRENEQKAAPSPSLCTFTDALLPAAFGSPPQWLDLELFGGLECLKRGFALPCPSTFSLACAFGGAQVCAHTGGSRGRLSFNASLLPTVPTGGGQYKTPLATTLLTLVFELPLPASGWWVLPHTGGDGFPSLALRIPPGAFQRAKLELEFLKLHHLDPRGSIPLGPCLPAGAAESPQTSAC